MNILITNDDGWGFEGIQTLQRVAQQFGNVWVVAPTLPMSGISHQLTFEQPMTLLPKEHQSFSLTGTPADCVRVGLSQLGIEFDWVFSGINNGANLGADLFVSGTVAGAREATLFGCRAISLSQYLIGFRNNFEWNLAEQLAVRAIENVFLKDIGASQFVNINFPDTQGQSVANTPLVWTESDRNPLPATYQKLENHQLIYCGKYKDRKRDAGKDAAVCFDGKVSLTIH